MARAAITLFALSALRRAIYFIITARERCAIIYILLRVSMFSRRLLLYADSAIEVEER